ncbi:MAG: DNA repair protein RecN [Anaerolineae bacterium]|nr:DNA repair protein RecN [Anaerolineae bacterium]
MLREIHIKDFAIIDELHLRLEAGLNILTGETGAGKSILIDAVALLLGGRADTTAVRKGASRARVEGMFLLDPPQQAIILPLVEREGLEGEQPDTLWLSRELRMSGRTVARVNGSVVSVALLREIAECLVDIHGQSEHLSLLRVREHLTLLDRFANLDTLRAQVQSMVRELLGVRHELRDLRQNERERMQRIDLLRFQVQEITEARLEVGEHETLEAELVRLSNAEQLASLASGLLMLLEEGTDEAASVVDLLGQAQRDMNALARIDASLSGSSQQLAEIGYQVEDVTGTLRDYLTEVEFNPKRLRWVQERLSLIRQMERKYGGDIAEVIAYAKQAAAQLQTLEHSDERIAELVEEEQALLEDCARQCERLSQQRQEAAARLSAGVEVELNDLRMQGARFGVAFQWRADEQGVPVAEAVPSGVSVTSGERLTMEGDWATRVAFDATGMDQIEFLIAPNVGEGLKPMTRIASGGETARLMLALKTVLSRADQTPTLIFDEIDQGIGGRVGTVVGAKLWRLTSNNAETEAIQHQVLCITHLPQLAGFGDVHFRVQKRVDHQRTVTDVIPLQNEARLTELAQMLGTAGDIAQQGAAAILEQATAFKGRRVN